MYRNREFSLEPNTVDLVAGGAEQFQNNALHPNENFAGFVGYSAVGERNGGGGIKTSGQQGGRKEQRKDPREEMPKCSVCKTNPRTVDNLCSHCKDEATRKRLDQQRKQRTQSGK